LGIAIVDSAGDHYRVGIANVPAVMPDEHARAQRLQPLDHRAVLQVGALDLVAEAQHDFGNTGHAGTADTDEMHAVDPAHPLDHVEDPASSRQSSAIRSSALGCASARALSARAQSSSRLDNHSCSSEARLSAARSRSCTMTAAPASAIDFAFAVW